MENGNGQASVQFINTPFGYQPIQPQELPASTFMSPPPICAEEFAEPVKSKHDRSWMRTPEGRAKLSASIKAGWAKKRLRDARVAAMRDAKERTEASKHADIDKAIAYHLNAINTLRAAKALLK